VSGRDRRVPPMEDDDGAGRRFALASTVAQLEVLYAEREQGAPDDVVARRRRVEALAQEVAALVSERDALEREIADVDGQTAALRAKAQELVSRLTRAALESP
jgi:predicted  nucleic acid-binding Zn-ribbon protein